MAAFDFAHRPAALLFDMDGLLLDSERIARDAFLEVSEGMGPDRADREAFFLTLVGSSTRVTRERVAEYLPGADHAALEVRWDAAHDRLLARGVPLRPGVADSLDALRGQGVRMAVVTSTHRYRALERLETAEILHHFELVTGGDEVPAPKPDPAPYVQTAAALGLHPRECAAFEDSDRGIAAAMAAGCRGVQIPDRRPDGPRPALGQAVATALPAARALFGLP